MREVIKNWKFYSFNNHCFTYDVLIILTIVDYIIFTLNYLVNLMRPQYINLMWHEMGFVVLFIFKNVLFSSWKSWQKIIHPWIWWPNFRVYSFLTRYQRNVAWNGSITFLVSFFFKIWCRSSGKIVTENHKSENPMTKFYELFFRLILNVSIP